MPRQRTLTRIPPAPLWILVITGRGARGQPPAGASGLTRTMYGSDASSVTHI